MKRDQERESKRARERRESTEDSRRNTPCFKQKGMNMEQKITIPEQDTSPLVHPRHCRAVRNLDARTPEKKQKNYIQVTFRTRLFWLKNTINNNPKK
jgi:hypothetical protein